MSAEVTAWLDTSAKSKDVDWHVRRKKKRKSYLCHRSICIGGAKDSILGEELQKDIPSGSDQGSPLLTPDQKLGMHKSSHQAASPSSGRGIPITIGGEGFTEFPSLIKKNQEAEDDNADSLLEGREDGSYEELLEGIIELLKKLELTRERLKGSDEEIERLKNELVNEISVGTHLVQGKLKLAQEDVAMLNAELDSERRKVLESQARIAKYERDLSVLTRSRN
ncbi:hypothetical protein Dsin_012564 [Dipteronia sinensis]|uniref:Uncharacterized protein n=1 Tax=Dipteronia sinensis TaxID=43782 RepID=A0AAE0AJH5_9ROSI|nr:hypothetical protein Dsin_012564 [Dipteronia sinensis]